MCDSKPAPALRSASLSLRGSLGAGDPPAGKGLGLFGGRMTAVTRREWVLPTHCRPSRLVKAAPRGSSAAAPLASRKLPLGGHRDSAKSRCSRASTPQYAVHAQSLDIDKCVLSLAATGRTTPRHRPRARDVAHLLRGDPLSAALAALQKWTLI